MRNRWNRPIFFGFLVFLIGFGPFARTPWYTVNDIWAYQSYLGNMDNVALGCLFGLLAHRLSKSSWFLRSQWPLYLQIAGAVLILFIADWPWPSVILGWHIKHVLGRSGLDVTVLGLGTCLVMLGSVMTNSRASRWTLPLRWLGRYSYEVYLSHELVVIAIMTLYLTVHQGPITLWIVGTVLLCGLVGYLVSVLFSEPINRRLRGAPLPAQLTQ